MSPTPLVLHLSLASTASGAAQVFWQEREVCPAFHRDRSQAFEVEHDQTVHDYSVQISPQSSVLAVRIDPGSGRGGVRILKMHLSTTHGRILHTWTFEQAVVIAGGCCVSFSPNTKHSQRRFHKLDELQHEQRPTS